MQSHLCIARQCIRVIVRARARTWLSVRVHAIIAFRLPSNYITAFINLHVFKLEMLNGGKPGMPHRSKRL